MQNFDWLPFTDNRFGGCFEKNTFLVEDILLLLEFRAN